MKKLQERLGYQFTDISILKTALTHKSAGKNHYEKLEFLGDSILNYCISSLIFQKLDDLNEGKLSILRARLVSKPTLSQLGETLEIDSYIRTENQMISHTLRADVMESLIGAIYIDGNIKAARQFIKQHFSPLINTLSCQDLKDPKSHLQELTHQMNKQHPCYTILSEVGKSHDTTYTVQCKVGKILTNAEGKTKRTAEKRAAKMMIAKLTESTCE